MEAIIKYTDKNMSKIEFDNLEDAYSFTFDFNCQTVEVIGYGVYTVEEFQKAFSNDEFMKFDNGKYTAKNIKQFIELYGARQSFLKIMEGLKGDNSEVAECLVNMGYRYSEKHKIWFSRDANYTASEQEIFNELTK